jgi:hypothetical protein
MTGDESSGSAAVSEDASGGISAVISAGGSEPFTVANSMSSCGFASSGATVSEASDEFASGTSCIGSQSHSPLQGKGI